MITDLQPGPALDRLFAERVEGLEIVHASWPCGYPPDGCSMDAAITEHDAPEGYERRAIYKRYDPAGQDIAPDELGLWCDPVAPVSADRNAAMDALERFVGAHEGMRWTISRMPTMEKRYIVMVHSDEASWSGSSSTLAHAITLAILAALPKEGG